MSSLLTTIREFLGPPDPRSEREIEDDIDAEFAFHVEQIKRELIEQGVPPEHAADLARARFGNQQKLKQRCKRIALEERIMLQKLNTVLMIIVMLAVVGVSIQMYVTQRHNTLVLQDITTQIAEMRIDAQTPQDSVSATIDANEGVGHVLVEGDIERPGYYPVQLGETLRRDVLIEVGVDRSMGVQYFQRGSTRAAPIDAENYLEGAAGRRLVGDGDRIFVVASPMTDRQRHDTPDEQPELPPGTWVQVDETGRPLREPLRAELFGPEDVRSLTGVPTVHVTLHDHERSLTIPLQSDGTTRISVQAERIRGGTSRSRWRMRDDGVLEINITPAVPEFHEPLLLRHVDSLDDSNVVEAAQAETRILIEGDIERPGWYPIRLDEATYVHDLLKRTGVNERQWVRHRRAGDSHTRHELTEIYFSDDRPSTVMRPGDEIYVADETSESVRAEFAVRRADTYLYPYEWRQIDGHGGVLEDGWMIRFDPNQHRGSWFGPMTLIHAQREASYPIQMVSRPMGLTLIVSEESEEPEETRRIGLHCSFDVESMTLTITGWTGHDRINRTEEDLEELLVQIGLPRELTFGRFPRE